MDYIRSYASPLGNITLACDGTALTGLWFDGQRFSRDTLSPSFQEADAPVLDLTVRWLDEYFNGREPDFLVPLSCITKIGRDIILVDIPGQCGRSKREKRKIY